MCRRRTGIVLVDILALMFFVCWFGQVAAADLTTSARVTAAQVAQTVQTGTKGAKEQLSRFVEGEGPAESGVRRELEPEKREFWDSFGAAGGMGMGIGIGKKEAIGTAVVRKKGVGAGAGAGTGAMGGGRVKVAGKEEGWGDEGWERF